MGLLGKWGQIINPHQHHATTTPGHGTGTTFVVHVGGQLHTTEGCVHHEIAEVRVGLEDKLSPQLHILAIHVPLIDQDRVVIVKLWRRGTAGQRQHRQGPAK